MVRPVESSLGTLSVIQFKEASCASPARTFSRADQHQDANKSLRHGNVRDRRAQ
jgi:hypothetical protein